MKFSINFWWFLAAQILLFILQLTQTISISPHWLFSPMIAYFIFSWVAMKIALWGLNKAIKTGKLQINR